jgi:hypothetical protein
MKENTSPPFYPTIICKIFNKRKTAFTFSLILFCLLSSANGATLPIRDERGGSDTTIYKAVVKLPPKAAKQAKGSKLRWYEKIRLKIIEKLQGRLIDEGETKMIKKVLSVVSLLCGVLTIASYLVAVTFSGGLLVLPSIALVTGIIALINNKSKSHKIMAVIGVVLGGASIIAFLVVALMPFYF